VWRYHSSNLSFTPDPGTVELLQALESRSIEILTPEVWNQLVFVTANSADHFHESIDAIASLQAVFPSSTIYYYDLGLDPVSVEKVGYILHYYGLIFNVLEQSVLTHLALNSQQNFKKNRAVPFYFSL